jgi:hypothetical protein
MNARQRVHLAINHQEPDRIPLDLSAGPTTGMHVSSVYMLRQAFELDPPSTPVKVIEPYQMLGEIQPDLMDILEVDVVGVWARKNMFGYLNEDWKPWTTFDGTPVLVPGNFNTQPEPNGDILMYPEGDCSAQPSGRMPAGGYYFDSIIRQAPIDDANLNVEDNLEEFEPLSKEDLDYFSCEVDRLYTETDKAIMLNMGGTAFGDIALVPAPFLKDPRGIRDVAEWYMSTVTRFDYVQAIFERQCEIALKNLEDLYRVVENKIDIIFMTGTDFGTQNGPFISPKAYHRLYLPFQKRLNDWVHENTDWKVFIHSCGSIVKLLPGFIEAGFDILNPVQTSAAGMDPKTLKSEFGDQIVFWGGGIDTQKTLPFGTPDEVRKEVEERIEVFGPGGGFVFNSIHNVQAAVPGENLQALYDTFLEYRFCYS